MNPNNFHSVVYAGDTLYTPVDPRVSYTLMYYLAKWVHRTYGSTSVTEAAYTLLLAVKSKGQLHFNLFKG